MKTLLDRTPTSFHNGAYRVVRLDSVVNFRPTKLTPKQLSGTNVVHYSIPNVQLNRGPLVEDGGSIDSDKWQIHSRAVLVSKLNPRKATICIAVPGDLHTVASTEFLPLMVEDRWQASFIEYVLKSAEVVSHLASQATSVTRSHQRVSPGAILKLGIPWPTAPTRRRIVDYLDRETTEIDALVVDFNNLVSLSSERLSAAVDGYFYGVNYATRALKRLPIEKRSGVSVNAAARPSEAGELGVLATGSVTSGYFNPIANKAVVEESELRRLSTPVVRDSLIVNRANTPELVGSAAYVPEDYPTLFLSDLLWQLTGPHDVTAFLATWSKSRHYSDQISAIRVGTSVSMQKISYEKFARLEVPLPPKEERLRVVDEHSAQFEAHAVLTGEVDRAIALAKERRAALITAAVTGQIDVTAKHKPVAEQLEDELAEAR